jgi:hypothetical protein
MGLLTMIGVLAGHDTEKSIVSPGEAWARAYGSETVSVGDPLQSLTT